MNFPNKMTISKSKEVESKSLRIYIEEVKIIQKEKIPITNT